MAVTRGFPPTQPGAQATRFLETLSALPDPQMAAVTRLVDEQIAHPPPDYLDALIALDVVESEHVLERSRIKPDVSLGDLFAEWYTLAQRTAVLNAGLGLYYSDVLAPHHVAALYAAFASAVPFESL